jgi:hypothetical protein
MNAELIAAYIREANETEAVMQQRERDGETKVVNTPIHHVPVDPASQSRPAEPEISVSDAPDLPEPKEDDNWFDEALLDEPIEEIGEF